MDWTELLHRLQNALTTLVLPPPAPAVTLSQALGLFFWVGAAIFSSWFVRRQTRLADVQGAPVLLRLTSLGMRWLAPALCVLLALDTSGLLPAIQVLAFLTDVTSARLFDISGAPIRISDILVLLVIIGFTFWGTALIYRSTSEALERRGVDTSGTVGALLNLGRYVLIVVGLMVALTTARIDLTAIFTVGAVFAVTIGFALQNIAQNFVSGIILLVEGTISPGDILEVEGRVVKVVKLGMRSTIVRSLDDEDLIVPNSVLAQGTVKNLTMLDDRLRIHAGVQVAYDSDLDVVRDCLRNAALTVDSRVVDRDPAVFLEAFDASGVAFSVHIWIPDPWVAPRVRSELRFAVWQALKAQGVRIPYPQLDVHLDPRRVDPRP